MEHAFALEAALYLMQFPSQVKLFRARPLPDGVAALLRIASGDDVILRQASEWLGRDHEIVRRAAIFFLEQVLLDPDADSYRVLGAQPNAENSELRRNMALLLRWLHPDIAQHTGHSVFAGRVTRAWNDLKTDERRERYDRGRRIMAMKSRPKQRKSERPTKPRSIHRRTHGGMKLGYEVAYQTRDLESGFVRRVLSFLLDRLAR
jgi:hypothetical protein